MAEKNEMPSTDQLHKLKSKFTVPGIPEDLICLSMHKLTYSNMKGFVPSRYLLQDTYG